MIDIHSHILPNIDDGAKSIQETYCLLNEAKNVGFRKIIATTHYMKDYYTVEPNKYNNLLNIVQRYTDIKLYSGNEVYLANDVVKLLKNKNIFTINNTRYILFELPLNSKPYDFHENIKLLLEYGLIPILAHPERYNYVQRDITFISSLIDKGVLIQSNYGSVIGMYGKDSQKTLKKMLKQDMVNFFATDAHKENTIYNYVPDILKKLKRMIGRSKLEKIVCCNPELVLKNENITLFDD